MNEQPTHGASRIMRERERKREESREQGAEWMTGQDKHTEQERRGEAARRRGGTVVVVGAWWVRARGWLRCLVGRPSSLWAVVVAALCSPSLVPRDSRDELVLDGLFTITVLLYYAACCPTMTAAYLSTYLSTGAIVSCSR